MFSEPGNSIYLSLQIMCGRWWGRERDLAAGGETSQVLSSALAWHNYCYCQI